MITNEILHLLAVRKESDFMFKFDFHKAFGSVSWVYLGSVMFRMGFDLKWIESIHECLSIAQMFGLPNLGSGSHGVWRRSL